MLRVSFIGSGNVATRFAARLRELGAEIVQICSRSKTPASELNPDLADVVIVAVSDDAIAQIVNEIPSAGSALWLHTAGSVGIDVFDPEKFPRRGVLYPLQTMLKNRPADWRSVPLLVEGDPQAGEIARSMSPLVAEVSSADRRRLHAAAVIGCNMVMYLWSLSERICNEAGLDFNMLRPLFGLTGTRVMEMSPSDAMTGPAKRGDIQTIQKHIDALPADIADTYAHLSAKMLSHFHPTLPTLPTPHSPLPTAH